MRRVLPTLFASLVLSAAAVGAAQASPCAQPADYVKATAAGIERQPLLRPYLVGGLAVLAVRQHDSQAWLELAVDSADTARRALNGQADKARFETIGGTVLVSCNGLQARAAVERKPAVAALW
jgi:hypothetical protein